MRRLNLVEKCAARLEPSAPRPFHEVALGGERVFLDPGSLAAFAAGSDGERAPPSEGLEPAFPPPRPRPAGASALCLSITHSCNLACGYCYVRALRQAQDAHVVSSSNGVRAQSHPSATMSRETARRALGLLGPPGPWRIGFFGGEPLLAWDLVREVTELARERARRQGVKLRLSLTTNGTLVTPERAAFLARNGFSLIMSLDGPRELHDAERRSPGGAGSFDRVLEGLRTLAGAGLGPRTTLRATFPLSSPELVRRLEFLNSLAEEGLARAVSVEPAWPTVKDEGGRMKDEEGRPHPSAFRLPPFHTLAEEYLAAARWAASRVESGRRVRFHHLEKALERILLMRPAGTECGAGFGYLEIAPSGEIHACHKAAGGAIGHVDTGLCEGLRAKWLENRWYAREACRGCWARNVCGGGCRAVALENTGSLTKPWPVACAVKRAQVRAALYVAAACSRERLGELLEARTRGPRPVTAAR